jgi:hypothetical protein
MDHHRPQCTPEEETEVARQFITFVAAQWIAFRCEVEKFLQRTGIPLQQMWDESDPVIHEQEDRERGLYYPLEHIADRTVGYLRLSVRRTLDEVLLTIQNILQHCEFSQEESEELDDSPESQELIDGAMQIIHRYIGMALLARVRTADQQNPAVTRADQSDN